jgi:small subunit ribosomal protein S11
MYLTANQNNSIVTLTTLDGKVIAWSSSGKVGFKNTKKSTPFAAQKATEEIVAIAKEVEANAVHLVIKGIGSGRDSFIRAVQGSDLQIKEIRDITMFPFGGCKPHNRRRV